MSEMSELSFATPEEFIYQDKYISIHLQGYKEKYTMSGVFDDLMVDIISAVPAEMNFCQLQSYFVNVYKYHGLFIIWGKNMYGDVLEDPTTTFGDVAKDGKCCVMVFMRSIAEFDSNLWNLTDLIDDDILVQMSDDHPNAEVCREIAACGLIFTKREDIHRTLRVVCDKPKGFNPRIDNTTIDSTFSLSYLHKRFGADVYKVHLLDHGKVLPWSGPLPEEWFKMSTKVLSIDGFLPGGMPRRTAEICGICHENLPPPESTLCCHQSLHKACFKQYLLTGGDRIDPSLPIRCPFCRSENVYEISFIMECRCLRLLGSNARGMLRDQYRTELLVASRDYIEMVDDDAPHPEAASSNQPSTPVPAVPVPVTPASPGDNVRARGRGKGRGGGRGGDNDADNQELFPGEFTAWRNIDHRTNPSVSTNPVIELRYETIDRQYMIWFLEHVAAKKLYFESVGDVGLTMSWFIKRAKMDNDGNYKIAVVWVDEADPITGWTGRRYSGIGKLPTVTHLVTKSKTKSFFM